MIYAVVGIIRSDGSFSIPAPYQLGPELGVQSPFGIRNRKEAERWLNDDITGLVFVSSETDGFVEEVGEGATATQHEAVHEEFMSRNPEFEAPHDLPANEPVPISQIRPGVVPAGTRDAATANQPENELLLRYQSWLGRTLTCWTVRHVDSPVNLRIDAYDESDQTLIEAKSSAHRTHVLHAIGQLLDYGRLVPHERKIVLLPAEPERDLIELCHAYEISIYFEKYHEFHAEIL